MNHNYLKILMIVVVSTFLATMVYAADCKVNPGGKSWADSYSAGGKCYCATSFDHGIGNYKVNTPAGVKTVREVCKKLGPGPGIGGNPIYNTVQCGHGPAHGDKAVKDSCGKLIADEKVCPGRVDQGSGGCNKKGPKWDLSVFDNGSNNNNNNNNSDGICYAKGSNRKQAENNFRNKCKQKLVDCDPAPAGGEICANVRLDQGKLPGGNNNGGNDGNNGSSLPLACKVAKDNACNVLRGGWCNVWNNGNPKFVCRCGPRECQESDFKY